MTGARERATRQKGENLDCSSQGGDSKGAPTEIHDVVAANSTVIDDNVYKIKSKAKGWRKVSMRSRV